ncbi:hypothetical protein PAMP_014499 [Pampus punctatissimus]
MNNSHQEVQDIQETEFGDVVVSKPKRIIHFTSGETLEEKDSEDEEEHSSNRSPFSESTERSSKTRFSFKNVAVLVGRLSLLTCDFLGERLAGALGLNAAKYQYAIDQYHREHKTTSSQTTKGQMEGQAETTHLSPGQDGRLYGATGDIRCPADPQQKSCDGTHMDRNEGCHNRAYEVEES